MKLWLDDVRHPDQYGAAGCGFIFVQHGSDAILQLAGGLITFATLDHDVLGTVTGLDVLHWMEANNVWPVDGVRVHSHNAIGFDKKMQAAVDLHYPAEMTNWFKAQHKKHGAHWRGLPPKQ